MEFSFFSMVTDGMSYCVTGNHTLDTVPGCHLHHPIISTIGTLIYLCGDSQRDKQVVLDLLRPLTIP